MTKYLLADTETTGIGTSDRVVEIAWRVIDDDFNTLDEDSSLINPLMPIPAGASAVHGITNRDVDGAPTLDEYVGNVLGNRLGSEEFIFTAHNAQFDFRYLQQYLTEDTPQMCTLRLARKIYPFADNHKLGTLVYSLELDVSKDRFHSAEGDMDVLHALLRKMSEDTGKSLYSLYQYAAEPVEYTTINFGKHRGTPLKNLPTSYVSWLLGLNNLDPDLRSSLEKALKG